MCFYGAFTPISTEETTMKKQIAFSLVLVMLLSLLAGCSGTAVV